MKENWFKLITFLGILLACISVGYYFIIYLPKTNSEQKRLENQIKCQQEGNEQYERDKQDTEGNTLFSVFYSNPEFKFNEEMNTCLYKVERRSISATYHTVNFLIKDIYTNKEIFNWIQSWDDESKKWKDTVSNKTEWDVKFNELFRD